MSILQAAQELLAEGPYAGVPMLKKGPMYHIGDLSKNRPKGGTGLEGDGLPVSENPEAWSRIAKLGGDLWFLQKKSGQGQFMNMLAAMKNRALRSRVTSWAVNSGWATQGKMWKASWEDDEWESTFTAMYASREEAEIEHDEEFADIEEISTLVATPKLNNWWSGFTKKNTIPPTLIDEMVFYLFARDQTEMDGVWWNETLDVSRLSAPRGSIFQERLKNWERKKINWKESPSEDEEA